MSLHLRKLIVLIEETHAVARSSVRPAAKKVLVGGVIKNPLAGSETTDDDLSALIALGEEVGDVLGKRGALALGGPVAAYGKAVIVGTAGQLEHGAKGSLPAGAAPARWRRRRCTIARVLSLPMMRACRP